MRISNNLNLLLQCSSLICAIVFNSLLIYLIITKSPKKMGNYKALMIYFSTFSMVFAVIDMIVQPFIHSYGSCFFMIMSIKDWPFTVEMAQIALSILCGCGGVTPFLIAIHFIYRFFALERKGNLKYFSGTYLFMWFLIPIAGGINWFHLSWFYYRRNDKTTEYIKEAVLENFGLHMNETVYSAALFYPADEHGVPNLDIKIFISYVILSFSMVIPFAVMLVAGVKSHSQIKKLIEQGECDYTKRLQLQLYKALLVQTFLPIFLFFMPMGALFSAPLFHIDIGSWSYLTTYLYALYPAVDPLPIMFIVQEYRNAFIELFDCFRCSPPSRIEDSSTIKRDSETV
ncbi:Serpentine receptor class r-10 [Caenorhabditis elegans]|uniref:Serpentine receptor class r-10 n=1 Tax=Caenorhabditis elegans TaxID=6239 RepID=O44532_CAEEL|nr:Seven TM Receptor [Caenorhabditis elegans]CCD73995.1 Seven TM Receptor [Caenorhabditis elegans]|eukprot:NP_500664.1 Seven TM Receptor [Caenorhabditis elegans]